MLPVGNDLRKLNMGAQLQTFPYLSKSFLYSNTFMAKSHAQTDNPKHHKQTDKKLYVLAAPVAGVIRALSNLACLKAACRELFISLQVLTMVYMHSSLPRSAASVVYSEKSMVSCMCRRVHSIGHYLHVVQFCDWRPALLPESPVCIVCRQGSSERQQTLHTGLSGNSIGVHTVHNTNIVIAYG